MSQLAIATTRRSIVIPIVVLLSLPLLAVAQDQGSTPYEYAWGKALMEDFRLDDMAERVFTDLTKSSDREKQSLGSLGLSKLKRRQASQVDDAVERSKLNEEATSMLREVAKAVRPGSLQYFETQFDLADLLQAVAGEDIDAINAGLVPPDKIEEYQKKNENRLSEAELIYSKTNAQLDDADEEEDRERWLLAKNAILNLQILRLRKAENMATDPKQLKSPKREALLTDAIHEMEDFLLEHEASLLGMYAYLWYGRIQQALYEADMKLDGNAVTVDTVVESWINVPRSLIFDPEELDEEDQAEWQPASEGAQDLAQRGYRWILEFLNRQGYAGKAVEYGEKFRADWKKYKYEFNVHGRLTLVELGKAYQADGRSSEALEIAASVSQDGGFVGRQADQLMSLIIRTATNQSQFSPTMLQAGAEGAYAAGRNDPKKFAEAITLYQLVLSNLDRVADPMTRNDLARKAWYRIGHANGKLGRMLEASIAFENGYKNYNTDQTNDDPKLNEDMRKSWEIAVRTHAKDSGSAFAKTLVTQATDWMIANPSKAGASGVGAALALEWQRAEGLRRSDKFDEALPLYEGLASKQSEYQERAMVKMAGVHVSILQAKKAATTAEWVAAAKRFQDYKDYVAKNPEGDPTRADGRKLALVEADFQIADCHAKAAEAETNPASAVRYWDLVLQATDRLEDRTKDENLLQYARYDRFRAFLAKNQINDAAGVFDLIKSTDMTHRVVVPAAQFLGGALKGVAEALPSSTPEQVTAKGAAMKRAADAYRVWLLAKKPNDFGYWTMVYKMYYDYENWESAYDILAAARDKFSGTRKIKEKEKDLLTRRIARCLLEKAKIAYRDEDEAKTNELFQEAAKIYDELIGEDGRAPITILEEAAEIYGGFLTGPNRRGNYVFFAGAGEFEKAQEYWHRVDRSMRGKDGETPEERLEIARRRQQAYFYKFLMEWKIASTENSNTRMKKLANNLQALFQKLDNPGEPGFVNHFRWLKTQIPGA